MSRRYYYNEYWRNYIKKIEIEVHSNEELNRTVQMYIMQGFKIEIMTNERVTLKKKDLNIAILILLIIFLFIIGGLIYYLICEDEMVIIRNSNIHTNNLQKKAQITPKSEIIGYCTNCGIPLTEKNTFCINCGIKLIGD